MKTISAQCDLRVLGFRRGPTGHTFRGHGFPGLLSRSLQEPPKPSWELQPSDKCVCVEFMAMSSRTLTLLTPSPSPTSLGVSVDNKPRLQTWVSKGATLRLQGRGVWSARAGIGCGVKHAGALPREQEKRAKCTEHFLVRSSSTSNGATNEDAGVNLEEEMSTVGMQRNLKPSDGVVIVDHGSRRAQSNEMLHLFVDLYKQKTGHSIVEAAHMELAEPSISHAFDRCVEQGAKRVIICPYFFFPGRHWDRDIPALASKAAEKHMGIPYLVTAPIGLHELMVQVMTDRMEYCLSRVAGDVAECDMCKGTGRCQQLLAASSSQPAEKLN